VGVETMIAFEVFVIRRDFHDMRKPEAKIPPLAGAGNNTKAKQSKTFNLQP